MQATCKGTMKSIATLALLAVMHPAWPASAPELVWVSDAGNNRDLTLSPDGNTLLTTRLLPRNRRGVILVSHKQGDDWSPLAIAPFSGRHSDIEPMFSPDGSRVWFSSTRPRAGDRQDWDIWFVTFDDSSGTFGEPVNAGEPVNTSGNEFYPSVSRSGVIYFTSDREGGMGIEDIYRYDPATPAGVENLGAGVNSAGDEFNAFVAPDQSYLLFTAWDRDDDLGRGDLYLSRGDGQGNFGQAVHLDAGINSPELDYCPFVVGSTLYFTSERTSPPPAFSGIRALDDFLQGPGNGFGDIYRVAIDSLIPEPG